MKLRNVLGVSALTLLLGISMSGVSANADDTTPSTKSNVNQSTTEGNLSLNSVNDFSFNSIDLNNGDSQQLRTVGINGNHNITVNNNTGSDWSNASLSVKGTNLSAKLGDDKPATVKNARIINSNNESANLDNSSSLNIINNATISKGSNQSLSDLKDLKLRIPLEYNMPQGNTKNVEFNTQLTWTLTQGTPSSNGQK
ncbi:hypothetical protein [Apilactobacillus timberlakei]|uniref:WxL domain-containing protein n=1 Tax=Apilactobacillus timberlakei TaxID=2008380 RepID=A0ABY2YT57_9LACO|nr:hypothetical protein [Apilactobacillus timberlakei]TPR14249.1 hypothetical protein DY048_04700 [Apilactobacillus timberlakei]TPR16502.1 hypothetical protein DY052_02790 [Apilactobacillus timberlakei]